MPQGMFNKLTGYLYANSKSLLNAGNTAGGAALAGLAGAAKYAGENRMAASAALGGVAGGVYGAVSDNHTIMGGAMMGASLGAGVAHYGAAAMSNSMPGASLRANIGNMRNGVANAFKQDFHGATMGANQAVNKIKGLYRK